MKKLSAERVRLMYKTAKRTRWIKDLAQMFTEGARTTKAYSGTPVDLVRSVFSSPGVGMIPLKAVAPRNWLEKLLFLERNKLSDQAMRKMVPLAKKHLRGLPREGAGWMWGGKAPTNYDLNKFLKGIYG